MQNDADAKVFYYFKLGWDNEKNVMTIVHFDRVLLHITNKDQVVQHFAFLIAQFQSIVASARGQGATKLTWYTVFCTLLNHLSPP